MMLTPRQLAAYLEFTDKLDRIDRANDLAITAIGAQGRREDIEKARKELTS